MLKCTEDEVYEYRISLGIRRAYKMVDTCAAEFPAQTPYFYSTFEGASVNGGESNPVNESIVSNQKKVIVLGSGPNRLGQGIEFDYSCVHGLIAAKESGYESIMNTLNPNTGSTDFKIAAKINLAPVFGQLGREIFHLDTPKGEKV